MCHDLVSARVQILLRGSDVLIYIYIYSTVSNISNPTMRTGLDFKSAQFDQVGQSPKQCE
jgi:hypothetical protein